MGLLRIACRGKKYAALPLPRLLTLGRRAKKNKTGADTAAVISHPEPENMDAALEKAYCISSKEPNDLSMTLANRRSCQRS